MDLLCFKLTCNNILHITIAFQIPSHSEITSTYAGGFDSLALLILSSYPNTIVISKSLLYVYIIIL